MIPMSFLEELILEQRRPNWAASPEGIANKRLAAMIHKRMRATNLSALQTIREEKKLDRATRLRSEKQIGYSYTN